MRTYLILLSFALCAGPAFAQPQPATTAPEKPPVERLFDPAVAQTLARTMQALSNSFLDLRVGEMQAAIEGRPATAAERKLTVRDLGRRENPNFERELQRQVANAGPMVEQSMKAIGGALPAMKQSLEQVERAIERAAANMPDPTYPKR